MFSPRSLPRLASWAALVAEIPSQKIPATWSVGLVWGVSVGVLGFGQQRWGMSVPSATKYRSLERCSGALVLHSNVGLN